MGVGYGCYFVAATGSPGWVLVGSPLSSLHRYARVYIGNFKVPIDFDDRQTQWYNPSKHQVDTKLISAGQNFGVAWGSKFLPITQKVLHASKSYIHMDGDRGQDYLVCKFHCSGLNGLGGVRGQRNVTDRQTERETERHTLTIQVSRDSNII